MTTMYTLSDLDLENLRGTATLVRVDFNVPLDNGRVLDDTRLRAALPTIEALSASGARVALMSHCGRPQGQPDARFSLRPVAPLLEDLLNRPIAFAEDCIGDAAATTLQALEPGGVCLFENLRFHLGETTNDPNFSAALAALGAAYVDDAFGTAHRVHASVVGVAERFDRRAAGHLLINEVVSLTRLLDNPARPFAALVGGAKIDTKVDTVRNLLPRLDLLVLGGGMANTFLAAQGHDLSKSLVEQDKIGVAKEILDAATELGIQVVLPTDLVVTDDLEKASTVEIFDADALPPGMMAVDIGPTSRKSAAEAIAKCQTVLWNGPMGVFERPPFDAGTIAVADAIADCAGYTVIGGGETVAAAKGAGVLDRIGHVSTGGGASLEFLAGKTLPGVAVLERTE